MASTDVQFLAQKVVELERKQSGLNRTRQLTTTSVLLPDGTEAPIDGVAEAGADAAVEIGYIGEDLLDVDDVANNEVDLSVQIPEWIRVPAEATTVAWDQSNYAIELSRALEETLGQAQEDLEQAQGELDQRLTDAEASVGGFDQRISGAEARVGEAFDLAEEAASNAESSDLRAKKANLENFRGLTFVRDVPPVSGVDGYEYAVALTGANQYAIAEGPNDTQYQNYIFDPRISSVVSDIGPGYWKTTNLDLVLGGDGTDVYYGALREGASLGIIEPRVSSMVTALSGVVGVTFSLTVPLFFGPFDLVIQDTDASGNVLGEKTTAVTSDGLASVSWYGPSTNLRFLIRVAAASDGSIRGVAISEPSVGNGPTPSPFIYAQMRDDIETWLWIDTTEGKNTPKRWNSLTQVWDVATDKAALDAAANAQTALDTANAAAAQAQTAEDKADQALNMAGGSRSYYSSDPASGTAHDGDVWRQIDASKNVIAEWFWQDDQWNQTQVTTQMISNLDVGKLTVGNGVISELVAQNIASASGQFMQLDVSQLRASSSLMDSAVIDKIWAESVVAKFLTATEKIITEDVIATGAITGDKIQANAIDGMTITGALVQGGVIEQVGESSPIGIFPYTISEALPAIVNAIQRVEPVADTEVTSDYALVGELRSGGNPTASWSIPTEYEGGTGTVSVLVKVAVASNIWVGEPSASNPSQMVPANTWTRLISPTITFEGSTILHTSCAEASEVWVTDPIVTITESAEITARLATTDQGPALAFYAGSTERSRYLHNRAQVKTQQPGGGYRYSTLTNGSLLLQSLDASDEYVEDAIMGVVAPGNNLIVKGKGTTSVESDSTVSLFTRDGELITYSGGETQVQSGTEVNVFAPNTWVSHKFSAAGIFDRSLVGPLSQLNGGSASITTAASTWAYHPGISGVAFTTARSILVRADFGGIVKGTAGYVMHGILCTGALSLAEQELQVSLTSKETLYGQHTPFTTSTTDTSQLGFKYLILPAGVTNIYLRVRRSATGTHSSNYAHLSITPIRYLSE